MRTKKQFTKRILILVLAVVIAFGIMPMTAFAASTSVPGAEGHVLTDIFTGIFDDGYDSTIIVYATPNVSDSMQYRIISNYGAFAVPEYDSDKWHFAGWKTWYKGSHSGAGLIISDKANPKYDDNENYFTVRTNSFISGGVEFPAGSMSVLKETLWKGTYYLSAIFEPLVTVNAGEGISYTVSGATKRADNKYSVKYDNGLTIDYSVAEGYIVTDVSANYGTNYSDNGDIVSLTNIVRPATVTVNARRKQQKVTFNSNGGSGTMTLQSYSYGEAQALTANNFTRNGYTFAGWDTKADGTGTSYTDKQFVTFTPANDGDSITLYAQWKPKQYTVSLDTNGGEAIEPINITFDEKYGNLPSSSITGLSGSASNWYLVDENGSVTDINITKSTTVSVVGNHTLFMKRNVLSPNVNITLTVPGGISNDYTYFIPGASQRVLTATVGNMNSGILKYTYQWYKDGTLIEDAVSNVLNLDGNVSDGGTYKVEVTATLKNGANIVVTTNSATGYKEQKVKILHAANTISYDANGGEGGPQSAYTGGTGLKVSKDEPTREHFDFIGWNTVPDGSGDNYKAEDTYTFANDGGNGGCVETLYAQWKLRKHTVTYKADGQPVSTEKVEYGKDATLPTVPAKEGYVGKWDSDGKNIEGDTTISVIYTEIPIVKPDEVKPEDKTELENIKAKLEEELKDGSYTEEDKQKIQDAIDHINDALKVIGNVETAEELIEKLPDTIKKDDEAAVKAADDAYNALTVYEKSLVDEDAKKALDDAKAALAELNKPADPNSPATGDNSNLWLWVALLFVSGTALLGINLNERKRKVTNKKTGI